MAYPLAPWIGPPESITKSFATGLGIATDVANQRAKIDADAASQQLWANLERQKQAQQQQYQQAGLAQDAQRLAMEQQAQQLKGQEYQTRFDALNRFQSDIAGGMDPIQAAFRNLPGTGDSLQGIGALARQLQMEKNYKVPLPDPTTILNPANQQKYGVYYNRGTEGEPEPSLFPTAQAKVDPYELALFRDELKGYDDDIKRAEEKLSKMDLDPSIQAAMSAEKPNAMAQAQKRAYQKAQQDVRDAVKARDTFRASRPFQQSAAPAATAPAPSAPTSAPTARTAPVAPGSGAQFTYDPASGKIVPRGQTAPAAPTDAADQPPAQDRPFFGVSYSYGPNASPGITEPAPKRTGAGITIRGDLHVPDFIKDISEGFKRHPNLSARLSTMTDKELYDLYVKMAGKRPALPEGTREELVDLIVKLQQQ